MSMNKENIIREKIKELRGMLPKALVCSECKKPIHEGITGRHDASSGVLCTSCFVKLVGDEIEQHPICTPLGASLTYVTD